MIFNKFVGSYVGSIQTFNGMWRARTQRRWKKRSNRHTFMPILPTIMTQKRHCTPLIVHKHFTIHQNLFSIRKERLCMAHTLAHTWAHKMQQRNKNHHEVPSLLKNLRGLKKRIFVSCVWDLILRRIVLNSRRQGQTRKNKFTWHNSCL